MGSNTVSAVTIKENFDQSPQARLSPRLLYQERAEASPFCPRRALKPGGPGQAIKSVTLYMTDQPVNVNCGIYSSSAVEPGYAGCKPVNLNSWRKIKTSDALRWKDNIEIPMSNIWVLF